MRRAAEVTVIESEKPAKTFTPEEFLRVMRSANLVGAFGFWRSLEQVAQPDERTRVHARGVLRALAELHFRDCNGVAYSPQHAEAFRYCGFEPIGVRAPGSLGRASAETP